MSELLNYRMSMNDSEANDLITINFTTISVQIKK